MRDGAAVREGLRDVPRVVRPQRTYYLAAGRVDAVTALRQPGSIDHWQRPDLWWPDDLRWFVATDVDCWSLYVGGSGAFAADLVDAVPTAAEHVTLDHALVAED